MKKFIIFILLFLINFSFADWVRLFGSPGRDEGYGTAVDSSANIYITGRSGDSFPDDGQTNSGSYDIIIAKYNSNGDKQWVRLLGSTSYDVGYGIAVDSSSNIYITGQSGGSFPDDGQTNSGGSDIIIAKYNSTGDKQWVRLLGSTSYDVGFGIAVDSSSTIYISGYASGNLPDDGQTNSGGVDIIIAKYNSNGDKQWVRLLGSLGWDEAGYGIAVDSSSNIYITGYSSGSFPDDGQTHSGGNDILIAKYNSNGDKQWVRLLGTTEYDQAYGIAVDLSANIYIIGYTRSSFPDDGQTNRGGENNGGDIIVAKFNYDGDKQWVRLLGSTSSDYGYGVAVDSSSNIYITGQSGGSFPDDGQTNSGGSDIIIAKYNSTGDKQWVRLLGTTEYDQAYGIAVDLSANIYIIGYTRSSFPDDGQTNRGGENNGGDIIVAKFNYDGDKQWVRLLGSTSSDYGYGVAVDSSSNIYITGHTYGSFPDDGQTNSGVYDIIIAKYNSNGDKQWVRLLGSTLDDYGESIAVDSSSNIYITGVTFSSFPDYGQTFSGGRDIIMAKFDADNSTFSPTFSPTEVPSVSPTNAPSELPSSAPSQLPSPSPTVDGTTSSPSNAPSQYPSLSPSTAPTNSPTVLVNCNIFECNSRLKGKCYSPWYCNTTIDECVRDQLRNLIICDDNNDDTIFDKCIDGICTGTSRVQSSHIITFTLQMSLPSNVTEMKTHLLQILASELNINASRLRIEVKAGSVIVENIILPSADPGDEQSVNVIEANLLDLLYQPSNAIESDMYLSSLDSLSIASKAVDLVYCNSKDQWVEISDCDDNSSSSNSIAMIISVIASLIVLFMVTLIVRHKLKHNRDDVEGNVREGSGIEIEMNQRTSSAMALPEIEESVDIADILYPNGMSRSSGSLETKTHHHHQELKLPVIGEEANNINIMEEEEDDDKKIMSLKDIRARLEYENNDQVKKQLRLQYNLEVSSLQARLSILTNALHECEDDNGKSRIEKQIEEIQLQLNPNDYHDDNNAANSSLEYSHQCKICGNSSNISTSAEYCENCEALLLQDAKEGYEENEPGMHIEGNNNVETY